ncbi:syntaxin-31-like [Prosopis cineraria]|uniref:syntaxin-31-like n=1 Tax=Prosopis cineraria TaxID=364024 RepID=UPI00240EBB18|nr:syntaxin-31-like [Prosopis cineraria]
MASGCRDRTLEFRSLSQTLKKIERPHHLIKLKMFLLHRNNTLLCPILDLNSTEASRIGLGIHEASQKISRLAQCKPTSFITFVLIFLPLWRRAFVAALPENLSTLPLAAYRIPLAGYVNEREKNYELGSDLIVGKEVSMFNDPTVEIQELTALIKNDITALNSALSDLQTIQNMEIADGNYSEDRIVHSTAVCDDLKGKLMGATKQLHDVLTSRTENIKAHENRKQIFSKKASRGNPFQHRSEPVTEPPPWSNSLNASESSQQISASLSNEITPSNQLRRRLAADNAPSQQMEMSMMQQVVPRQESYSQSRATALHSVESTITELSGIFTHLATMVAHQGELAIRIDDNMDESLANVEGAHSSLLKHLSQISSNRWLLIKIFAVLILFLLIFIFFVA